MTLEALLGPAVPATYLVLLALEALRPARVWLENRWWRVIGGAFFLVMGGIVTVGPLLLPAAWIAEPSTPGLRSGDPCTSSIIRRSVSTSRALPSPIPSRCSQPR
jgi:hypothetical protein